MLCLPLFRSLRTLKLSARTATLGAVALGMLLASAVTAAAAPDLIAEKITLNPTVAYLGSTTFSLSLTIRNIGNTAAGPQITRIWASKDSQINGAGNDVLIFTLPVPALAAGKSVTFTSTTTPRIAIDPNKVGPYGTDFLPRGTYIIGVQVDAYNQVPNEASEDNIFKGSNTLYISALKPVGPITYLPVGGTDNVSVARTLQWTTVTNANRYDVFLSRLKDTEQRFYPHALINMTTTAQRVVLTDMKGTYDPNRDPGLMNGLPNNTPDILIAHNGMLLLYNRIYDALVGNPRYQKPVTLFDGPFTTAGLKTYMASRKFGPGIISAVTPANINFYYNSDRGFWENHPCMDVVFATYSNGLSMGGSSGNVYVAMNKLDYYYDFSYIPTGDTITSSVDFMLLNVRNSHKDVPTVTPLGIKSLVVADFDHDSDLDIMAGSDRYAGSDKIVVYQSDYRNSPNGNNDPWPYDFPIFTPRAFGNMDSTIEDAQDMAVIDVDRDDKPDVVVASYHSDRLWLLYNKTKDDGGIRTTRTLSFDIVGPLPTDDLMTTSIFRGANTVCVRDLNNDGLAEIIAGCYFDGKIVVYENQSYGPGGVSLSELVPHVLSTGLPNLEKVTTADMNGDGVYDILVSSATNDLIIWFENKGNFQFVAHTVTQNANRVGSIIVNDLNNDLMPDIVSYSQYDKTLTWYMNWPILSSANLAGANVLPPQFKPRQLMDFNTTYVWKVVSKAADLYSTNSDILTFRTQPTRIVIDPIAMPVNPIEPTAGLSVELHTKVDGPQSVGGFGIQAYADPIWDRGFLMANDPLAFPPPSTPMNFIGVYSFFKGYGSGGTDFLTPKFDQTSMPEGLYNLWLMATGSTPCIYDGTRNGVMDGIPDGVDNHLPGNISQGFTNPTYGDDVYLAQEKLAVIRKPGLPMMPTPRDNSINVPTAVQLGWTTTTYTTGYDVYMAAAASTLPQYTSMTVTGNLANVQAIAAGDLNKDGMPDVAASQIAGPNDARIYWMNSISGGRAFGRSQVAGGLLGAPLLKIADMDQDGLADLLAGSAADGQIWWYKNRGGNPVVFAAPTIVGRGVASINSMQAIDMDNDRDMDVLVASSVGSRLYYYERTSRGGYTLRTIDASQGQALYARAADLDQDGDMDVIASFWSPNSVAWYENKGGTPPTYVRHVLSTTINNPRWLAAGDLDGDNDPDIAVVSQVEGKIYQFLNNGAAQPSFSSSVTAQGIPGAHGLEIVDFNHDCRPDLVTATTTGNKLLYLMNNGSTPLSFTQFPIQTYPNGVMDLATADMDQDNFGEVIGASSGVINWYDYVVNYNFTNQLTKANPTDLTVNAYKPGSLSPAMGYRWQVLAKRTVPIYGGTLERVTSSSLWTFFTGQSDLVAQDVTFTPTAVEQGQSVNFTVKEANSGFSDSQIHFADIWASPDPIITRGGNDILLKRVYVGVVPAQSSTTKAVTIGTAAVGPIGKTVLPEGNYYIGIFVDPLNQDKSESSKDNNKLMKLAPMLQIKHKNSVGTWTDYR